MEKGSGRWTLQGQEPAPSCSEGAVRPCIGLSWVSLVCPGRPSPALPAGLMQALHPGTLLFSSFSVGVAMRTPGRRCGAGRRVSRASHPGLTAARSPWTLCHSAGTAGGTATENQGQGKQDGAALWTDRLRARGRLLRGATWKQTDLLGVIFRVNLCFMFHIRTQLFLRKGITNNYARATVISLNCQRNKDIWRPKRFQRAGGAGSGADSGRGRGWAGSGTWGRQVLCW